MKLTIVIDHPENDPTKKIGVSVDCDAEKPRYEDVVKMRGAAILAFDKMFGLVDYVLVPPMQPPPPTN